MYEQNQKSAFPILKQKYAYVQDLQLSLGWGWVITLHPCNCYEIDQYIQIA